MRRFSPRQLIKTPGRLSYHDMILGKTGLVSYWNFGAGAGNVLSDQIGGNDGTISGATWTQKSNGIWMLDFDGDNDDVNVIDDASLRIGNNITLEGWFYAHNYVTGVDNRGAFLTFNDQGYRVYLSTSNVNFATRTTAFDHVGTSFPISLLTWYHLAAVQNTSNILIYINGNLVNSNGIDNPPLNTDRRFLIGKGISGLDRYFDGFINEVAIYNVALTSSTILKHYQVGVLGGLAEA